MSPGKNSPSKLRNDSLEYIRQPVIEEENSFAKLGRSCGAFCEKSGCAVM